MSASSSSSSSSSSRRFLRDENTKASHLVRAVLLFVLLSRDERGVSDFFSLSLFVRAYFCSNAITRGESIKLPFFLRRGLGFFHLGFRFIFFPLSSRLLRRHHSFPHFYTLKKKRIFRACSSFSRVFPCAILRRRRREDDEHLPSFLSRERRIDIYFYRDCHFWCV